MSSVAEITPEDACRRKHRETGGAGAKNPWAEAARFEAVSCRQLFLFLRPAPFRPDHENEPTRCLESLGCEGAGRFGAEQDAVLTVDGGGKGREGVRQRQGFGAVGNAHAPALTGGARGDGAPARAAVTRVLGGEPDTAAGREDGDDGLDADFRSPRHDLVDAPGVGECLDENDRESGIGARIGEPCADREGVGSRLIAPETSRPRASRAVEDDELRTVVETEDIAQVMPRRFIERTDRARDDRSGKEESPPPHGSVPRGHVDALPEDRHEIAELLLVRHVRWDHVNHVPQGTQPGFVRQTVAKDAQSTPFLGRIR